MIDYVVIMRHWLDGILMTDLWTNPYIWFTGKKSGKWVEDKPKVSDICCRVFKLPRSEWKRKVKEGAVEYGKNGFDMMKIAHDVVIDSEGYHEIRYGRKTFGVVIPEPWYSALWLRFARLWDRTVLAKLIIL